MKDRVLCPLCLGYGTISGDNIPCPKGCPQMGYHEWKAMLKRDYPEVYKRNWER